MKIASVKILYRVFSFLSDKTHGFWFFAKYKLILGTLLIGSMTAASCSQKKRIVTVDPIEPEEVLCYVIIEEPVPIDVEAQDSSGIIPSATPASVDEYEGMVFCYDGYFPVEDTQITIPLPPTENEPQEEKILTVAEQMPQFPGGDMELKKFLIQNISYQRLSCYEVAALPGTAVVRFVVRKDGKITDIELLKSSSDTYFDTEAIRIIESMPNWIPGMQNGQAVSVYYTLPIKIKL